MMKLQLIFLLLSFWVLSESFANKSCDSKCTAKGFPKCGTWMHADNSKSVAGVYFLNNGKLNLTCTVNSLPKPATVAWEFRKDFENQWEHVRCSSLRTVTDCSFNSIGEHRVFSSCLLKMGKLEQSGIYRCTAEKSDVSSGTAHVHVYGISNITLIQNTVSYGDIGEIKVKVCAKPKPDLVWIHGVSGVSLSSGQSAGNYSALPLHGVVEPGRLYAPAHRDRFCYIGKLIISGTQSQDRKFTVIASNTVDSRTAPVHVNILNEPVSSSKVLSPSGALIVFAIFMHKCFRE